MIIEQLRPVPPAKKGTTKRCAMIVESGGTGYWNGNKNRCARNAFFKIDEICYCSQHAGQIALVHVMKTNVALPKLIR